MESPASSVAQEVDTLQTAGTAPLWQWSEAPAAPDLLPCKRKSRVRFAVGLLGFDICAILAGFLLLSWIRHGDPFSPAGLNILAVLLPIYLMAAFNMDSYGAEVISKPRVGIFRSVASLFIAVGLVLLAAFFLKASAEFSRLVLVGGTFASAAFLGTVRFFFGVHALQRMGANPFSELIILDGVEVRASNGVHVIDAAKMGLCPSRSDPLMLDRLGTLLMNVDRVFVACPPERRPIWAALLKGANIRGELLAKECEELGAVGIGRFGGHTTMTVSLGPLDLRGRALKRALDIAVTIPLLVFLAPLMLLIACAIRLESNGPIFFTQRRLGRGNRLFTMLKFRSMRVEVCDPDGHRSTLREDGRATRVGRFIRATSMDELPQLLNVLRGDMSLVGPRPHALGSLAGDRLFWEVDDRYWFRHACKPGITGLAQVRGWRGATSQCSDLQNRLDCDLEYLAGWTIWRDVAILLRTVRVLIHPNAF